MKSILLNVIFGLIPTMTLAWSIAADERKSGIERVVASTDDRTHQHVMFALIYGLWALTLAMWNWMREESPYWIGLWLVFGLAGLAASRVLSRRRKSLRDV